MSKTRTIVIIACLISLYSFISVAFLSHVLAQTELITNGGLESGSAGWILSGNFYADSRFSSSHSGSGYAYLSNPDGTPGNNLYGTMYQSVTIPSTTTMATLTFWYNITSQENGSTPYDALNITIQNSSGNYLATVAVYSNVNKDPAPGNPYYHQQSFDMTPYKGQTVRLHFLGTTDDSYPTTFRIDDVSILAVAEQPVLSVTPDNRSVLSTSGSTTFEVANNGFGTMNWTASVTSGSSWLSISSGGSGQNSGTITVAYTTNNETYERVGNITVTAPGATGSPKVVTVTQAGSTLQPILSVTPDNRDVSSSSGSTTFDVANNGTGTMDWTSSVTSGSSWLSITSGGSGQNSGTITATYMTNSGTSERFGTVTVTAPDATGSPKSVTVTQAGSTQPVLTIPYIRQNGDTDNSFNGKCACGATSAVMIASYYDRLPDHPITCTWCPPSHTSDYGWYVAPYSGETATSYSLYGFTFNIGFTGTVGCELDEAYGAYGFIHYPSAFANTYYARNYFWKHGLFSKVIDHPSESDVKKEIDKGHPIWASTNLWNGCGHIVVIKGYSNSGYWTADPWPSYGDGCAYGDNEFYTWIEMGRCVDLGGQIVDCTQQGNCTGNNHWLSGPKWIVTTDPITPSDRVRVTASGVDVKVRSGPGKSFGTVGTDRNSGDVGTILSDASYGPFWNSDNATLSDFHTWVKIQWDKDNIIGWSAIGDDAGSRLGGQAYTNLWIEKINQADNPPIVNTFYVNPLTVVLGNSFTISYAVSDDIGLNRVELWDSTNSSEGWQEINRNYISGTNNSGFFSDTPTSPGTYWYGVHVVDNIGQWSHEPNPPGPTQVMVTAPTINVTVQANPIGCSFSVDGTLYTTPQTFTWTSGSSHTIATSSPQSGGTGTQYVWSNWSDGSAISHSVAPTSTTTYIANFATQYYLTISVNPGSSGSIGCSPSTGPWYNSGQPVQLTANVNSGYQFDHWSGDLSGSINPTSIIISGPKSVTANFVRIRSVTVTTDPSGMTTIVDGNNYTTPHTFNWIEDSNHSINVTSPQAGPGGQDYYFSNWSDGGGQTHQITVPNHDATYTASFAMSDVEDFSNEKVIPNVFELSHNYPNPFNPSTQIEFGLPKACYTKIEIFNVLGEKIKTLVDEFLTGGYKGVYWNGKDENGNELASGVYFYRLQAGDFSETKKMILLR